MKHESHMFPKSALLIAVAVLAICTVVYADDWNKRTAHSEWTWFEDYAYLSATYVVACEPGRLCQVGMGVFAFGEPRGEKIRFTEQQEITVIGIGAIHIRSVDGIGPVKAALIQKGARPIPLLSWTFP